MSVWPALDTFCTIMSTLMPASASVAEDRRRDTGPVGHLLDRHLGLGGVVRDPRDDRLLHRSPRRVLLGDPRSRRPGEARTHVHLHAVIARELDRTQREHAPAGRRHLEHLVERDARQLARRRHDPRVGGVHAFDVGVDLAHVGAERGRERDRGGVGTAAAQRRDVARRSTRPGSRRRSRPCPRRAPRGCARP